MTALELGLSKAAALGLIKSGGQQRDIRRILSLAKNMLPEVSRPLGKNILAKNMARTSFRAPNAGAQSVVSFMDSLKRGAKSMAGAKKPVRSEPSVSISDASEALARIRSSIESGQRGNLSSLL